MPDTVAPNEKVDNTDIVFEPIKPLVGTEVKNIDLTKTIGDAAFARLRREFCERSVLIIRNQSTCSCVNRLCCPAFC